MKHLLKLSLLLLALSLPAIANAYTYAFEVDGIYYDINGNDAIVTYKGTTTYGRTTFYSGDVIIPSTVTYKGITYSVTAIGGNAFEGCTNLTSIEIPNSVTSIGNYAFYQCISLTSVTIPNSVISIGDYAFYGCSNLNNIIIPNYISSIGRYALHGTAWYDNQPDGVVYAGLVAYKYKGSMLGETNIIIRDGARSIAGSAFSGCTGLTSIDIPNTVTSIGYQAFKNCSGLTSINIPNSVINIEAEAFDGTTWFENQPDGLVYAGLVAYKYKGSMPSGTSIIIRDGTLGIASNAFYYCIDLNSVTIPNSVTSIGNSAFSECGLTSINIPNSVTSIGNAAFSGCSGLTSIIVAGSNPKYDSRNNCNAIIETSTNTLLVGCKNTIIPNSVTSIGDYAFYQCISLASIDIPNSVISIGDYAFQGCYRLNTINIPNSVISIGVGTFDGCHSLTSVSFGNSVVSIGDYAFSECYNLTSIEIPNSVTNIGDCAFTCCSNLKSITFPSSILSIGQEAFDETAWYNNQPDGLVYAGLTAYKYKGTMPSGTIIIIRDGTLGLANGAFASIDCSGLTSINIPNSVISIGEWAFAGCSGLTSIDIPNSVTCIDGCAFYGCSGLISVTVAGSNPKYDSRGDCNAIIETATNTLIFGCMNTVIPNSVTFIGNYAFSECSGLTSIYIPNSVTSIGENAFDKCTNLTSINIPSSVTSIGYGAFRSSGLTSIIIPNFMTFIGNEAFYGCRSLTEIYSFALLPPIVYSSTFKGCYGASLYVPLKAVNAYSASNYWKNFTYIAEITFIDESINYRVLDANTVSVIANSGEGTLYNGEVVIPDSVTYEGYTFAVTGIEDNAFDGCFELTSITIPNSVTDIGEQAFQGCTGLTSVTIGSGVTTIGTKAFNYCNALETVKCHGTVPPVMASADCFTTTAYNRATLLVPRNTEATYTAADYWYKFAHIDGWGSAGQGDVNGDGVMSIRDVTSLIDVLLGNELDSFYFDSADMNSNGRIDIGDVTSLIDNLLNGDY